MIVRKLEYLIALAREGHFARAAAECHVSQPTLSAAIRQLEAEMGVEIVKRGPRFHGLTGEGERVLAFAHRMASECEHLRQELKERGADKFGMLRLGVIPAAAPLVFSWTIPFHNSHPQVNLSIITLNPGEIAQAFEEYALDIAITYLDEEACRHSRTHMLYTETYSLLIRKGSKFSRRTSVSWADLSSLPLCLLVPEMQHPGFLATEIPGHLGPNVPRIETNSILALYEHVQSGKWASVLPASFARGRGCGADLEAIPLLKAGQAPAVGLMIPDRDLSFPLAEVFFSAAASATDRQPLRKAK
jgi:DNA-binding transcriptional LysR family regulator